MNFLKNRLNPFYRYEERKKIATIFSILKIVSYTIVAIIFVAALLFIWNLHDLKMIYQDTMNGKRNLENAVAQAKEKKFESASESAATAQEYFYSSINGLNKVMNRTHLEVLGFTNDNINDLIFIVTAAEQLSEAVSKVALFGSDLEQITGPDKSFSALNREEKRKLLGYIHESSADLVAIKDNIESALLNMNKLKFRGLINIFQKDIHKFSEQLVSIYDLVKMAVPASQIIPYVFGFPEPSSFLMILQNSDELRPTGGFIGTYGILETDSGEIIRSDTHDVYHMDMPVRDKFKVIPPEPLKKFLGVDNWYMRDANWDPNWVASAQKIEWFFQEENKLLPPKDQINNFSGEFDGVIGITPAFIIDLLRLTGPITIENVEYNEFNFTKLLEYRVEKGYAQLGVSSWQRKEVIGDIVEQMKIRLFDQSPGRMADIFQVIEDNLARKNLLLYLKDDPMSALAEAYNWSGRIVDPPSDYVMIIDSNMAAYKTDAVIDRNISYKVTKKNDSYLADLKITYKHNGKFDWRTTRYRSYTRVYVPLGSELIKAGGDNRDKFSISAENGKTVFNAFIVIEPGHEGFLHYYYKLPQNVVDRIISGKYNLYFQKQPGSITSPVQFDLNFNNIIKSYSPAEISLNKLNSNYLQGKIYFNEDIELEVNLSK